MPASGKDTQANLLSDKLKIPHISTGQIFRKAMDEKTPLGLKIDQLMRDGKFVDDETTIGVVKESLDLSRYILNGFPRNRYQAQWYIDNGYDADFYFYIKVSKEVAVSRIKERLINDKRPEDATEEALKNRFDIFENETLLGIDLIRQMKNLIFINGEQTPQKVYREIGAWILSIS